MRRAARIIGTGLLFLIVTLCLAIVCVPPLLDRVYYRGPVSDHFDGQRFFNPDAETGADRGGLAPARTLRFLMRRDRAPWPTAVSVTPGYPPAAATACPTRGAVVEAWARCVPVVDPGALWVTWIGHATALVQSQGLSILTDPVWSDRAGPFGFGPKRVRAPGIRLADLPKIDVVLLSHSHYDHMDLATLAALWARDRPLIVTSLGNDAILAAHGIPATARDWGVRVPIRPARRLADGTVQPAVEAIVERVHHWSTRWGKDRNRALWSGFTVTLPGGNLFFAGDTGFGDGRWADIAKSRGPIRLAILPIGAIEPREIMQPSHIDPAQAVEVFRRLHAADALAIHWGTFQLANEGIDAPGRLLTRSLAAGGIASDRFRVLEVGRPWSVPPLR